MSSNNSLPFRVFNDEGRRIAAVADPIVAAAIIAGVGTDGWTVRSHRDLLWTEGADGTAAESFDAVNDKVFGRYRPDAEQPARQPRPTRAQQQAADEAAVWAASLEQPEPTPTAIYLPGAVVRAIGSNGTHGHLDGRSTTICGKRVHSAVGPLGGPAALPECQRCAARVTKLMAAAS